MRLTGQLSAERWLRAVEGVVVLEVVQGRGGGGAEQRGIAVRCEGRFLVPLHGGGGFVGPFSVAKASAPPNCWSFVDGPLCGIPDFTLTCGRCLKGRGKGGSAGRGSRGLGRRVCGAAPPTRHEPLAARHCNTAPRPADSRWPGGQAMRTRNCLSAPI